MAVKAAVVGYEELTKPFDEESEVKVEESTEVTEEEEEIQDKELDELDRKDLEGLLMMDVDGEVETTEDEGDVGLRKSFLCDIADDSIPDRRIHPGFTL
jgi:protein kinase C substrate 80K-H